MSTRLGTIAIIISACGIALVLFCLNAYMHDDGISLKLAPHIAKILGVLSDDYSLEPAFRTNGYFNLSEASVIFTIGCISILLGLISVVLGFFSIKRKELPVISYGAIALGIAPIILVSIKVALVCSVFIGVAAVWYKKVNKNR